MKNCSPNQGSVEHKSPSTPQISAQGYSQLQSPQQKYTTLRDLYLEIPTEISKYLVEAGVTSLLNCIEIQKRMVLGIHYACSKLCQNFDPQGNEIKNTYNAIKEVLAEDYLKNEIKNFEKNNTLYEKLIKKIEFVYEDVDDAIINDKIGGILKFLKGGNSCFSEPRTSKMEENFKSMDEENDIFRSYYGLKEHDIIDEAEEIATHLMNEVGLLF